MLSVFLDHEKETLSIFLAHVSSWADSFGVEQTMMDANGLQKLLLSTLLDLFCVCIAETVVEYFIRFILCTCVKSMCPSSAR